MAKQTYVGGRCNNCIHWIELSPEKKYAGECRRYAPKPQDKLKRVFWPITKDYNWCGEYEPKT